MQAAWISLHEYRLGDLVVDRHPLLVGERPHRVDRPGHRGLQLHGSHLQVDLAGLPVALGEACRTTGERSRYFKHAVSVVRQALAPNTVILNGLVATPNVVVASPLEAGLGYW